MTGERFHRAFFRKIGQAARTVSEYAEKAFVTLEDGRKVAIRSDVIKNVARTVAHIWETWMMKIDPMLGLWTARCTKFKLQEVDKQYSEFEAQIRS